MQNQWNIILSAYAVKAYGGSEPGLGWNWARELCRKVNSLHILTEVEFKQENDLWLKNEKIENVTFHYISIGKYGRRLCWKQGSYFFYFFYRIWQVKAFLKARRIVKNNTDIKYIHHLNMIGYREPGFLHALGLPFVLGPLGGLNNAKYGFLNYLTMFERYKIKSKARLNYLSLKSPYVLSAIRKADLLLASNSTALSILHQNGFKNAVLMNETGYTPGFKVNHTTLRRSNIILWVGKLTYRKQPVLALDIFRQIIAVYPNLKLVYLGDGEQRALLESKILEWNMTSCVDVLGLVQREEVLDSMKKAKALLFTSIDEGTPHVLLEALAHGLPVFCHKSCGMQDILNDESFTVTQINYHHSKLMFTQKILNFLDEKSVFDVHITHHSWENKINKFLDLVSEKISNK